MIEIAEDEASTQFKSLIERVEHGEVIFVTRNGRPVARLHGLAPHDPEKAGEAIRRLRDYARQHPVEGVTTGEIKSWISEGRP